MPSDFLDLSINEVSGVTGQKVQVKTNAPVSDPFLDASIAEVAQPLGAIESTIKAANLKPPEKVPDSNVPYFELDFPPGTDADAVTKEIAKRGSAEGMGYPHGSLAQKPSVTPVGPTKTGLTEETYNPYDPVNLFGRIAPKVDPTMRQPKKLDTQAESDGALKALNMVWGLAKNPYDVVKGTVGFFASIPGFIEGLVPAAWEVSKALGQGADLHTVYGAASKGMQDTVENYNQAVVGPLRRLMDSPKRAGQGLATLVTGVPAKEEEVEDYSDAVGQIAMAPLNLVTKTAQGIADIPWLDDYPNIKGAIEFGGDIAGLLVLGRLYSGGASQYTKDVEPIITKADAINKQQKIVDKIPDEALKKAQEKVLEVEKQQLELEAKALQAKLDKEKIAEEELKAKAQEVQQIKDGKFQPLEDVVPLTDKDLQKLEDNKIVQNLNELSEEDKGMLKSLGYEDADIAEMKPEEIRAILSEEEAEAPTTGMDILEKSIEDVQPEKTKPVIAIRQGKIDKTGAYFSTEGQSTYYDLENAKGKSYDISKANVVESGSSQMREVLEKAKTLKNTPEELKRIEDALVKEEGGNKTDNFVDYMLFDEVPSIKKSAESLGYDGVKVWENDDIANPSSVFVWNIKKVKEIKPKKAKAKKVVTEPPQPVTDLDLQTGTPLPEKLSTENHPFREKNVERTNTMRDLMKDKIDKTDATPELFTRWLINETNRWLNGEEIKIDKVRNGLSELAARAEEIRSQFESPEDFEAWKDTVKAAAQWARNAKKEKGGTKLNMMIPINEAPQIVKDLLGNIKAGANSLFRNKEIFDKTGFWFGKDGKWRYEIDDSKLEISPDLLNPRANPANRYLLTNFIKHSSLYEAVPELKDVTLKINRSLKQNGTYYPENKTIEIKSPNKDVIVHELQHAVNDIMGSRFKGSNVEVEAYKLFLPSLEEMRRSVKSEEVRATLEDIIKQFKEIDDRSISASRVMRLLNDLRKKESPDYDNILSAMSKYNNERAFQKYQLDPGEMEARLSEQRNKMTAEQKKAEPPWETLDTLLDVEGYGDGYGTTGPVKAGTKLYMGLDPTQIPEATKKIIEGARRVAEYTKKARGMKEFKPLVATEMAKETSVNTMLDKSGNVRRELLHHLSDEGYRIMQKMYLEKGSSSLAALNLKQMQSEVYSGLTKNEKHILDDVILDDRMVDIARYKTEKQFKFPEELKATDFAGHRSMFQYKSINGYEDLSNAQVEKIESRAKAYFEWMKVPLGEMLKAELISQAEYDLLVSHNYRRLKLVDIFDKRYEAKVGAKKITVYDSGVEALSHGRNTDIYEPSSEVMALEVFNRAYGRIFNNEANKMLLDLARTKQDNPFVRVKEDATQRVPSGWDRIFVYERGQRKALYISPELAKEWITNNPEMGYRLSQFIRYLSGSAVLRTFATGIDWGFALANLPRDIMHIWFASRVYENGKWKSLYSPVLPFYGAQMGADIAGVFHDAVLRKGKYIDYIKAGGGMEFLVHQGRLMQRGRHIESGLDKVQDFLGYLGETSEIMTRLAIRDRVIKRRASEQGISYEEAVKDKKITQEATFAARDYMDFGQGGSIAKALDNGVPYLNASIQGTRGLFRSFKDNPISSTFKLSQFAALVTGLYIANQSLNPNTMKDLKGDINMQSNLILPLGDGFGFLDEKGQMRYPYLKIPLDPGQKFFKMFFEASYDKSTGQPVDAAGTANALSQISPVGISSLPPTASGVLGYFFNKDFWADDAIWKKTDKALSWPLSKEEYIPGQTPQALIDFGAVSKMSPERTKYALSELVTSGSPWSWLVGQGYDKAFGDIPPEKKEMHLAEVLAKTPMIKRFFGITNPYSKYVTPVEEVKEQAMVKRWIENRGLDVVVENYLFKGGKEQDVLDYIRKTSKDVETEDRLQERYEFQKVIKNLPNRAFWLSLKSIPDTEARARLHLQRFNSATPEERAQLRKEEAIIEEAGGIISEEFMEKETELKYKK